MPIDYRKYPTNWKQLRQAALIRAGNRCEWPHCGAPNYAEGMRLPDGSFRVPSNGTEGDYLEEHGAKYVAKIVLTIAHLDHDLGNNDLRNLRALCQYHHLRLDAKQHAVNAAETRRRKKIERGQPALFS